MLTYYQRLGVAMNANLQTIKQAYKQLALRHHPDKGGDDEQFKALQQAYEILSDKEKRQTYDYILTVEQGIDIKTAVRQAEQAEHLRQQQQREHDDKVFYVNPDADFTVLDKETQQDVIEKYRYIYDMEHRVIRSLIKESAGISPKTKISLEKHRANDLNPIVLTYLLQRARKYFTTIGRPYQAYRGFRAHVLNDLLQPLYGVKNSLMAVLITLICMLSLLLAPIVITGIYLLDPDGHITDPLDRIRDVTVKVVSQGTTSVISLIMVGLMQVITTPLTWLVVIPYRSLLTVWRGAEPIEHSNNIQRLLQEAEAGLAAGDKAVLRATTALLHIKFNHDLNHKKRHTALSPDAEFQTFQALETEFVLSTLNPLSVKPITEHQQHCVTTYLRFFKPAVAPEEPIPPAPAASPSC